MFIPVWGMIISLTLWCFGKWSTVNEIAFGTFLAGFFWIFIKEGDMAQLTAAYLVACYAALILWHHSFLPLKVPLGLTLLWLLIKAGELAVTVIKHRGSKQVSD